MANTKLKRAARARQRRTGERYTEALARVREEIGMSETHKPPTLKTDTFEDALDTVRGVFSEMESKARSYLEKNFPEFKKEIDPYAAVRESRGWRPQYGERMDPHPPPVDIQWRGGWIFHASAQLYGHHLPAGGSMNVSFTVNTDYAFEPMHDLLEEMVRLHLNIQGITWFPHAPFTAVFGDGSLRTFGGPESFSSAKRHIINLNQPKLSGFSPYAYPNKMHEALEAAWPQRKDHFNNDFFGYQARQQKEREEWDEKIGVGKHLERTEAVELTAVYRDQPRQEDAAIAENLQHYPFRVRNKKLPSGEGQWQGYYLDSWAKSTAEAIKRQDETLQAENPDIDHVPPDLPTWENPTTYLQD